MCFDQLHWDLELAAHYAKFIPRHTWCIKHKSCKHTFFINLFYLKTFSKKKEGICEKSSPFLKCFLTRQFFEFSFLCCSFPSWHAHFLGILLFFTYFFCMYKLYCAVRYTCYYTRMWFSLLFVDFYFTPYITTKHKITMVLGTKRHGWPHDRPYIASKTVGGLVRVAAAIVAAI